MGAYWWMASTSAAAHGGGGGTARDSGKPHLTQQGTHRAEHQSGKRLCSGFANLTLKEKLLLLVMVGCHFVIFWES